MTEQQQLVALAEALLESLPDDTPTRRVIMTAITPQTVLAELHKLGCVVAAEGGLE